MGEKKSEEAEGVCFGGVPTAPPPPPLLPPPVPPLEKGLSGAAERRSSDMVLEAPTVVYRLLCPPGPCSSDLESARFCASAARLTLRWSDQATSPRQARIAAPMKPSAAPTQMKTVPSGRLDFCMKGALAVSGTPIVGSRAPEMVGRPVRWKTEGDAVLLRSGALVTTTVEAEVLDPAAVDGAVELPESDAAVVLTADDFVLPVLVASALPDVADPVPSDCDAVLRFGRLVAAFVAVVKRSRRTEKRLKGPIDGPLEGLFASIMAMNTVWVDWDNGRSREQGGYAGSGSDKGSLLTLRLRRWGLKAQSSKEWIVVKKADE